MRFLAALLANALPVLANGQAQLLPAGRFSSRDGRPGPGKHWTLTDTAGQSLAVRLNAITAMTPLSIDYEHQTLLAATNGQPAPAAGWIQSVEWRSGEGLFAQVTWTKRALALIDADEYRYISPVILYDQAGNVTGLHNAALVSVPALVGMEAVTAALAALFPAPQPNAETRIMELAQLIALLGLAAGATAADVTTAITALMARPAAGSVPAALATALGLQGQADEATALAAVTRLRTTPDAATLQQMTALQAQVATLQADAAARTVAELVDGAIAAFKLTPAQREWATSLGKADLAQLNAFIKAAPVIPGLAGQLNGRVDAGDTQLDSTAVALKAQAYQAERLAAGVHISTQQAVDHVLNDKA